MMLETMILPALIPALSDGLRGLFARFTQGKGAQPQNITEQIQLMQAQTERVKALAEMDSVSPNASAWVVNVRGVFRYAAVGSILIATIVGLVAGISETSQAMLLDMAGACMAFIIGERMYLWIKR